MSEGNVDRFMACVAAFNRLDVQAALRYLDPEIQFDHRLAELYGSYAGLDRVALYGPGEVQGRADDPFHRLR